ncbi:MAG TPA: prolyl oligopeptidase family serine peptidase [Azospirillum sp.]|nr:prolyl oligopeptidase family serine peptidase [Azospirillum sp.]
MPATAPYGTWASPVTARSLVDAGVGLRAPWRREGAVCWLESRANGGGRTVPVRRAPDGTVSDLLPAPWDVRGRVHEYGGGDVIQLAEGLVFCNGLDQAVYLAAPGREPAALTAPGRDRFADFTYDGARRRLIAVRERHPEQGHAEPENALVAIPLDGGPSDGGTVLVRGADFYASPRLSPDGRRLAWLSWNHPNMPWDGTDLWVADLLGDGTLGEATRVAGGSHEAVVQPVWLPDGRLAHVCDRGNWWNLRLWDGGTSRAVLPMEAEFARPLWVFGNREVAAVDARTLVCAYSRDGLWSLGVVDVDAGTLDRLELPFTDMGELFVDGRTVTFLASGPDLPNAVVTLDLDTRRWETVKRSSAAEPDPGCVSVARPIRFPTEGGPTGNSEAHAFYYPPANAGFAAPAGELPPLIVKSHGGPTAAASAAYNPKIQYWTSRGFAVVDVNYRGSTGYGRAYRDALKGAWGVADVADCVAAARHLAGQGLADPQRLIITGSSAGGYTVLCAVTFHDAFRAGASYYGISDLEALATDTHKFEARYLDSLVGPYPARKDLYVQRSPIHFVDRLSVPMVFFQGTEDKVVPPAQAERMVEAIDAKGLPVAYVAFEGERHGFRKAESIVTALEGELYFYGRVFGFTPAGDPQAIPIRNV